MNRRKFLTGLLLATPAALLLPKRTFFLPPVGGWATRDYVTVGEQDFIAYFHAHAAEDLVPMETEHLVPYITPLRNNVPPRLMTWSPAVVQQWHVVEMDCARQVYGEPA